MPKIIVNTTFRDFDGSINDFMQIKFLKSLVRQSFRDFILVVTIFNEKKVEKVVKSYLPNKCFFVYDSNDANYQFSLTKALLNGIDYGNKYHAEILVDCSADIILQKNFLEIVSQRCIKSTAGISHPNIFVNENDKEHSKFLCGRVDRGIDIRYFSMDIFNDTKVYSLLSRFPSYDYGASVEVELCGIAIKYAKHLQNIYMESKVLKMENDRGDGSAKISNFIRQGIERNIPTVKRFLTDEGLSQRYMNLCEINKKYRVTKHPLLYGIYFFRFYMKTFCSTVLFYK